MEKVFIHIQQKLLGLLIIGGLALTACPETLRLSRGTRIPPEHRGVTSAEVTETFTRHVRGEHLSMAATLIDFSYVRAITVERDRSRDQERVAYQQYIRGQTSFYVNLVLHGRKSCRPGRQVRSERSEGQGRRRNAVAGSSKVLHLGGWSFRLRSSSGRELEPEDIEPGATQLAPSGGCLVQGYVHFDGNLSSRYEWIEFEASAGDERRLHAELRWDLDHWRPAKRGGRPRPRPESNEERPTPDSHPEDEPREVDDVDDQGSNAPVEELR